MKTSRVAALECSPRREPWVKKPRQSGPEGAKEQSRQASGLSALPDLFKDKILAFGTPALSIVVKLEDDLGERGDWIMLHGVIPGRDERDFPLLRCIDAYGKTVFNHLQMEAFLEEWEHLRDRARDESQKEAWLKVKDMAQTCQQDRDLYLRFVGN
jgi:hypothetical protein